MLRRSDAGPITKRRAVAASPTAPLRSRQLSETRGGASGSPLKAVLLILGLLAAGLLIEQLAELLLAVVISVIVALPLSIGASLLERLRIPRALGAVITLLVGLGAVGLLAAYLTPAFIHQVDAFVTQIPSTVRGIENVAHHSFGIRRGTLARAAQRFADRYTEHPSDLLGPLSSIGMSLASAVAAIVVILISALYMAINPDPLVNGLVRLFPPARRPDAHRVLARIRTAWVGWLRGVMLDMLVLGGLLFLGMELVGLPFAIGFAVFSAMMTVIPNYGSVVSAIPPILFGLSHSLGLGIQVTVVYIVVNQIEGNLILPLIMGRAVQMHPALVAIGLLIVGSLFGLLGLFIAVPLISLALILVEELWMHPQEQAGETIGVSTGNIDLDVETAKPLRRPGADLYRAILIGAALVALVLLAREALTVLIVILMTVILSLPLDLCARRLERRGVPRPLGALFGLLAGLGVGALMIWLLIPKVINQASILIGAAPRLIRMAEINVGRLMGSKPGHVAAEVQKYVSTYVRDPRHLLGPIASISLSAATVVGGLVISVMVAYYIAARPRGLVDGTLRLFPPARRVDARRALARIYDAWLGWLRGLMLSSALIGVLLYLVLGFIVGLPFALSFAVISACAEVVPYLGALASSVVPVLFALTISPDTALEVLAAYIVIHQIESNIIAPLIMGRMVHLHPVVIAFGVIAVGELFGFLGLLVAVPMLCAAVILVEEAWVLPRQRKRPPVLSSEESKPAVLSQ